MLRALVLDSASLEKLAILKKHAEDNVFSMDDVMDMVNDKKTRIGDMKGFQIDIPVGFRVCYSMEYCPHLCRHLSISVDAPNGLPNVVAVEEIMKHLGFTQPLSDCRLTLFEAKDNVPANIDVMEIVKMAF